MQTTSQIKELPTRTKTIKVDVRTWDSLKSMKKENETFNDVIKELLNERTKAAGNENIKAIRYKRKVGFFTLAYGKEIGFEYEYNDVKSNRDDFILDINLKKVFFDKKIFSPSEFFGVDNAHKHYSRLFMEAYFQALELALIKEFRTRILHESYAIVHWSQLYYDYNLSQESFKEDIEEPLRLSEEDKPSKEWKNRINNSPAKKFEQEAGIKFKE